MKNLDNIEVTNGKDFVEKQKQLEELLGINKISPFGTNELEVFEDKLKGATQADMQKIAQRVGLNPFLDRGRLKKALIKEFMDYTKNSRRNAIPPQAKQIKLNEHTEGYEEARKFLGEF